MTGDHLCKLRGPCRYQVVFGPLPSFTQGLAEVQRGKVAPLGITQPQGCDPVTLFSRLLWRGYRKALEPKDLWSLGTENSSEELVSQLEREWRKNRGAAQR